MSPLQTKRLLASLVLSASAFALAQSANSAAESQETSPAASRHRVLLATTASPGAPVGVAAAAARLDFVDGAPAAAVAGQSGSTRDWTMILVGMFLIIAITGRRARTMFD